MRQKIIFLSAFLMLLFTTEISAQHIEFDEYTLQNGLHVILHQDTTIPVVTTSVMYHIGSKNEDPNRTGFAHFFEHLLFEGTQNIARGEWMKIVSENGGVCNASTTSDRTYYYETLPSNNLKLALWMESERMLHPIINEVGVNTQREVVKEEKRLGNDNKPYGKWYETILKNLFVKHPYRWSTIGSMDDLNAAKLDEFQNFFKKFYVPNNAVLVVVGDFDNTEVKQWINEYFADIPKGANVIKHKYVENPIQTAIYAQYKDPNIQLPLLADAYRVPSMKTKEARVLDMIASVLGDGKSSRLYRRAVDQERVVLELSCFNIGMEDYSIFSILGILMGGKTLADFQSIVDDELKRLSTELISEDEFQKIRNRFESSFVNNNNNTEAIAENLANYYLLYGNTNLINEELDLYKSITREDIRDIAQKYLQPNSRLVLDYLPLSK